MGPRRVSTRTVSPTAAWGPHSGHHLWEPPAPESPSQPPAAGAVGEAASSKLHCVRPPQVRVGDGVPTPSPPTAPAG